MSSSPSSSGVGDWGAKTPVNQPPLMSQNPQINYTGSFGQPSNNFQGMGKSPQVAPPMQQQQQMQQPMLQQPIQRIAEQRHRRNYNDILGDESGMSHFYNG